MKNTLVYIIASASASVLCGPSSTAVIVSSCAAALLYMWILSIRKRCRQQVFAINDPHRHNPEIIASAAEGILSRVLATGRSGEIHIFNPGVNRLELRFNTAGELAVCDAHRSIIIPSGEKWIADHSVPLAIGPGVNLSLSLTPAAGGRIRAVIRERVGSRALPLLLLPAAALFLLADLNAAAAALFSPILLNTLLRIHTL